MNNFLASLDAPERSDCYVSKLADGSFALTEMGDAVADKTKMTVSGIITTQSPDRSNDVVRTAGIDVSKHRTNPVVLLNHGLHGYPLPIGKAETPDGEYTVLLADNHATATTWFSQVKKAGIAGSSNHLHGLRRGRNTGCFLDSKREAKATVRSPQTMLDAVIFRPMLLIDIVTKHIP